ncbi:MAG: hypothetical protein AAGI03_17450 [Pseudomonadota bacterium]
MRFKSTALAAALCLTALPGQADPKPLVFTESLELEGLRIAVPMELYLSADSETHLAVKVAGNLANLQRRLPELLSDVVQDDCEMRVAFQVDEAKAEGDAIRANGRVQVRLYLCNQAQEKSSRTRLISHITAVDVLLRGGIKNNCLDAELSELALDPTGLVGAVLNISGLTQRIQTTVRDEVNAILNEEENCLELPDAMQLLDTTIVSGGFRDFGSGTLGFVVKGRVDLRANNVIALLGLVYDEGLLNQEECDCGLANAETVE